MFFVKINMKIKDINNNNNKTKSDNLFFYILMIISKYLDIQNIINLKLVNKKLYNIFNYIIKKLKYIKLFHIYYDIKIIDKKMIIIIMLKVICFLIFNYISKIMNIFYF